MVYSKSSPSAPNSLFLKRSNPYKLLEVEELKPKKKLKMVDSSHRATYEVSTQTCLNNFEPIKTGAVALKTIEQGTQCDEKSMPVSAKYPLDHVNFEVIQIVEKNLSEIDENTPEHAPYFENAGDAFIKEEKSKETFFGKALSMASNFLYWNVAAISNYFRTAFYRTENELLRDICDTSQEIRVSNSWFFGGDREVLYGLSHNSVLQTRLFNVPKWLYYEGFTSIFTSE